MRRKIMILCVTVLLILSCSLTAFAQRFDPNKCGSVSVTLTQQQNKAPIVGAELSVYHVATVGVNSNGNLSYVYTDHFDNSGISLDDPLLAARLDTFVSQNDPPSVKVTTNKNGTATCEGLELGLYFIKQTGAVQGFAPCTPFVVTVPYKNADGFVYEVNASPKTEVVKLTSVTVKKVWNVDPTAKPVDSVKVQLLQNGSVVRTATLNAKNDWQITYTDMPESDAYSIKEIDVPKGFTPTYSQKGYTFTVTNTSTLIDTGQLIWPIPVLSICGMLLIAVGVVLLQRKRKTNA